jgi:hypothetical protein
MQKNVDELKEVYNIPALWRRAYFYKFRYVDNSKHRKLTEDRIITFNKRVVDPHILHLIYSGNYLMADGRLTKISNERQYTFQLVDGKFKPISICSIKEAELYTFVEEVKELPPPLCST